ncbi:MAG: CDP-diacylglycerol--glycerol-3-phosphate 3-phosphatidyltransferase [Actinobacteria bacterium]|nr:CDP-diacylglycerol--glycerol-3-phosphate 3-phosphatidyltransferase [Actinomycetota bacterium]MDI6829950.1 CDP-diacylglycerol--glycerol-3-phosphate 3-phosphatidyltransferase [Actinomycetota bacterium]
MAWSQEKRDENVPRRASNLNLPNALSVSRMLLAPVIAVYLRDDDRRRNAMAAAAVLAAAATDYLDGHLARKQGKETRLGQFLDPLADKVCLSTAFVMLAVRGRLAAWIPGLIIGREALMTLFRVYAGSRGSSVPASIWGKLKTNSQLLALLMVIMEREEEPYATLEKAAVALAVALTLYSGLDYMRKASRYLAEPGDARD